ncbi:mazG nucleotide pyrophosphohydrolase domain protein [archaeon BMS3Abin16]|nr:mazG nucleotide pyrophosphohydrolase domain protein [archaeon BMS3Abin16]HDY73609.1 nucleotide pyrophosphohydrolase [Euryarchaeota archaeon]
MELERFQQEMAKRFAEFDRESGPFFLMTVLTAELGELAEAVKNDDPTGVSEELADLIFTAVSIANIYDLDISNALEEKYLNKTSKEISKGWTEPYLGKRTDTL